MLARHPIITGVVLFAIVLIGMNLLLGPATCRDGSHSSSIGKRGACSWHGGVDRSKGSISFIAALLVGGGVGWKLYSKKEAIEQERWKAEATKRAAEEKIRTEERAKVYVATAGAEGAPTCPSCGHGMIKRTARKGRHRGRQFWGCSRYPSCRGTRDIA